LRSIALIRKIKIFGKRKYPNVKITVYRNRLDNIRIRVPSSLEFRKRAHVSRLRQLSRDANAKL